MQQEQRRTKVPTSRNVDEVEDQIAGLAVKIPKKPPPLPLPPKSPRRYNSVSSSSRGAVSPTPGLPPPPPYAYSSAGVESAEESPRLSPIETESYFDALSIPPSPAAIASQQGSSTSVSLEPPSFVRRESVASSSCLSDEELVSLATQRRYERRTSAVPMTSPDSPNSQRRRHRRRIPSRNSGLSSSQTSISSAAGSIHASETESQTGEVDTLPTPSTSSHLSPRLKALNLDGQAMPSSSRSSSPLQARNIAQHPYINRDSQASTSTASFNRSRSSQATSLGPFDLDESSASEDIDGQDRQLQREFYDSFGTASTYPTHKKNSASENSSMRLSMPSTAHSFDSFDSIDPLQRSRTISSHSPNYGTASDAGPSEAQASGSNRYERSIPVVRSSPLSTSPRQSTSQQGLSAHDLFPEDIVNRNSSTSSKDSDSQAPRTRSRRASSSTTTKKRVGRIYSTSTVVSDATLDELRTPRVSVSNQDRLADSIYSTAGTAPDTFPYTADTSKELPLPPPTDEAHAPLGLGLPMPADSRRTSIDQYAVVAEADEAEVFKQPIFSRFSMYTDSVASSANSPTDPSGDQASLPPTPYSNAFRASVNSLSSSLNIAPPTPSINMSEDEKRLHKRGRIIQELVQTEEDFARDMALVRDVWLARAKGKEMGEIMSTLDNYTPNASRPISSSSSNFNLPQASQASIRLVERKSSAPQMQRNSSQGSYRSLKGLVNNLSSRPNQDKVPAASGGESRSRAASYSGTPRQRSISNVQALPPGAALYAPIRQADTEVIFGNVEAVAAFSSHMASLLREAQHSEEEGKEHGIGQTFMATLPKLSSVYSAYCAHFGDALQRWETVANSLDTYIRDCKDLCYGHTNAWDLPSLLIKPVQRCLKYPLFIQSLLDCTPEDHFDREDLRLSNALMLEVAESINEMKRRHEIVTSLVKKKPRSGLYGSTRRGSEKAAPSATKTPSGSSFTSSLSRRFKRSSRVGLPDGGAAAAVPEADADFEALLVQLETKHKLIQNFVTDSKSWSKAVRSAMVVLLQLTLAWKNVSSLGGMDDIDDAAQSSRVKDRFAVSVVRSTIEEQWRDMDQEIRKTLIPRATQLLELFTSPRTAIATRYYRYNESRSKASSKDYSLMKEHASAYHALNAQLKEELPVFMQGIDKIFTAMLQRFVSLQAAFNERMAEAWTEYIESCCTQLGPPDQKSNDSVSRWWQMHADLAQQLDPLSILAADKVIEDVERRQRNSLPPSLRPRSSGGRRPDSLQSGRKLSERRSRHKSGDSSTSSIPAISNYVLPPVPRTSSYEHSSADPVNRSSTFSSVSAGSLSFSGRSSSSVTSPPTPAPEYPVLWQGAVSSSFRPTGHRAPLKGFHFLGCEPGDLFEVLDESAGEKYLLVRQEGTDGDVGWLPAHLVHRLQ
ncbi:hypothetical protein P389DRAFT_168401 [Cystobasidium minutum MCA 4210]|uniref:uncharacterized protein n=1 Tax=Cystobasidium minutum MCA 4210 TaxID=1397322 RepID=UPI0034CF5F07|eukprot:jgi/Rhomi1/168401/fgenesh1_kg.2_\